MAEPQPIRVLIADDVGLLREVMRMLLEAATDINVIADSPHLEEALRECVALQPDVIVMNDYLPPNDSAYASRLFREQGVTGAILIVSMTCEAELIRRSFDAGANGFMHKSEMGEHLIEGVRVIHGGERYLSPKAQAAMDAEEA